MVGDIRVAFGAPASARREDTLVVITLRGGMDALTAVPPVGDPAYAAARPTIAVEKGGATPADGIFGFHPALGPLIPLWEARKLAVVHAAGQAEPIRSHVEASLALERAGPAATTRESWIDRMVTGSGPPAAVTLGDPALSASTLAARRSLTCTLDDLQIETQELLAPLAGWQAALASVAKGAPAVAEPIAAALSAVGRAASIPEGRAPAEAGYPDTLFGQALHDVARLIRADSGLLVAGVDFDGWDVHADAGPCDRGRMADLLTEFATALRAFADEIGTGLDHVTVVTLSEFGRRVAENGSGGTDHGHGGAVLLLGGGVAGGRIYGKWPTLDTQALVNGDLAVTTDYRQILAEVITKRCGVTAPGTVFPGLAPAPLGVVTPLASHRA
jgi:uncharacterized protein (DUF1501 family)